MGMEAAINWQDGTLRLYSTSRVSTDDYRALRENGFGHRRGETDFKASYTPERETFLRTHFELEIEDDVTDIADEAEARAERYEGYASNADKEYRQRYNTARTMADGIPFGQPILVGHHSEQRDRNYRERIYNNFKKGFEAYDRSKYWADRAQTALRRMEIRETPAKICRRIETLEADLRKFQRWIEEHPDSTRTARWIWFIENRLAFERALLAAVPPEERPLAVDKLEKGGAFYDHRWWYVIERVNQKTVSYTSFGLSLKKPITDIRPDRYIEKAQFDASEKVRHTSGGWIIENVAPKPVRAITVYQPPVTAIVPVGERRTTVEGTFIRPVSAEQHAWIKRITNEGQAIPLRVWNFIEWRPHRNFLAADVYLPGIQDHRLACCDRSGRVTVQHAQNLPGLDFSRDPYMDLRQTIRLDEEPVYNTLYTLGYTGCKPEHLAGFARQSNALVLDIRMSPRSRVKHWNEWSLKRLLAADNIRENLYLHVPQLGNVNYKNGGEIKLSDPDLGLLIALRRLTQQSVLLLCGCSEVDTCHRKTVAEMITERTGVQPVHLDAKSLKLLAEPPAAPEPEPDPAPVGETLVQIGMPGVGKDRVVQEVQPVQQQLL